MHSPRTTRRSGGGLLLVAVASAIVAVFILAIANLHLLGAGGGSGRNSQRGSRSGCAPSAILVNPCRPWLGAAAYGNPGQPGKPAPQKYIGQFVYLEHLTGHRLDIFRTYHSPLSAHNSVSNLPLDKAEIHFAERPHTYLDVNWKPAATWQQAAPVSQGGSPAISAEIRKVADNIKAISPHKIFLTIWWEPQDSVSNGTSNCCYIQGGCPGGGGGAGPAGAGSPAQYVAMWRNVESIFRQQDVRNVVWVMDYMSYPRMSYDCLVPQLWPGNHLVDWVVYDTYDHGTASGSSWDGTVGRFYTVLEKMSSPQVDLTSKPWGLGEFGTCKNRSPANAKQYYLQGKAAVKSNRYPRLKMYLVYADTGNHSGPACLTDYNQGPFGQYIYDPQKQADFNQLANAVFGRG